jgi:hypothetical protein
MPVAESDNRWRARAPLARSGITRQGKDVTSCWALAPTSGTAVRHVARRQNAPGGPLSSVRPVGNDVAQDREVTRS